MRITLRRGCHLEDDWDAMQRTAQTTLEAFFVEVRGHADEAVPGCNGDEGMEGRVAGSDLVEILRHNFDAGELIGGEQGGEVNRGGGERIKMRHGLRAGLCLFVSVWSKGQC